MRALTFRERLREEAAKSAAAETADPWRLSGCAARSTFMTALSGSARRCCWTYLKCHNAIALLARLDDTQKSWLSWAGQRCVCGI